MEHDQDLSTLAVRIPEPRNYFQGALAPELLLPTNVLLFHRREGRWLTSPGRSHHHRFVMISCVKGPANVVVDDTFVPLSPGQTLLVFPYQFHGYQCAQPGPDLAWIFVTFELERGVMPDSLRQRPVALNSAATEHLRIIATLWLTPESAERNARITLETALLLHYLASHAGSSPRRSGRLDRFDRTLARVCKNIQAHLHDGVRIKTLASDESISESHLRLLFRTRMGLSLGDYLQSMRMVRATQLLAQSELSIEEIGARCGYGSIYAFSRAFKKALKQSPRAFRKEHA